LAMGKYDHDEDDDDGDDASIPNAPETRIAPTPISFLFSYLTLEEMIITLNKNPGKTCSITEFLMQETLIFALPIKH